jgi:hypothetical protein
MQLRNQSFQESEDFPELSLPEGEGKALPTELPLPETTIAPQGLTYSKSMRCGPALPVHSEIRRPVVRTLYCPCTG